MVMRVGGLATGMDIDQIVNRLMDAERIPLRRLEQDRTLLTWKQEAFRDLNLALSEFDRMMLDMKMSRTYETKKIHSTQENAVTATGGSQAANGTYYIEVEQLATAAMNVSTEGVDIDQSIDMNDYEDGKITFSTFNADGTKAEHEITIDEGDTVGSILAKITNDNSIPVRAFIQEIKGETRVVLESTRTGKYRDTEVYDDGPEIDFGGNPFFSDVLKLDQEEETNAQNAKFTYNHGLTIESTDNTYRSEERRVGKECRSRRWRYQEGERGTEDGNEARES